MAKVKVLIYGAIGKVVSFDPNATVGAQIGTNLLMPDGSVATIAALIKAIGSSTPSSVGSTGAIAHSSLAGLTTGDDHPQYLRKDTLTTNGDIYVRESGVPTRFGIGAQYTVLMAGATLPAWTDISANPTGTIGLSAVNGTAHTFMRSDGAPALDQGIVPTWTGQHTYNLTPLVGAIKVVLESRTITAGAGLTGGGDLTANRSIALSASVLASTLLTTADETANFASSRRVLAGTGVTFDDSVSNVRTINATGTGGTVTSVDVSSTDLSVSGNPITTAGTIVLNINASAVTYAKIQNVSATSKFLGRKTAGAGVVEELSAADAKTILAITLTSDVVGTLQAAQFPALTGDVTTSAGSLATAIGANKVTTTTIAANAVTLAKLATQADQTILGNNTGGSAVPLALTAAQTKTLLAIAYTDVSGISTVGHTGAYSDLTGAPTIPTGANPSASVGLSAVNGSAATFMRSDGAPALSVAITPTWTGLHTFARTSGIMVRLNQNTASLPAVSTGTLIQIAAADGVATSFIVESFANFGQLKLRRANTTATSPSGLVNADVVGAVSFLGYDNVSTYNTAALIQAVATETWSATAAGGKFQIKVTPNTTTTQRTAFQADQDGTTSAYGPVATGLTDCTPDQSSYTGVATGFAATAPTVTIRWARSGNLVTMTIIAFTGTSNANTFTIPGTNIPAAIIPTRTQNFLIPGLENSGAIETAMTTYGSINLTTGNIVFSKGSSTTGWTNSGTKGCSINASFSYLLT